jgi:hypothetical protein
MHRYETGWDRIELNTLRKIAAALGASIEVRLIPDPKRDRELEGADLDNHPDWVLARVRVRSRRAGTHP